MGLPLAKSREAFPPCRSSMFIGLVSSLAQNMDVKLSQCSTVWSHRAVHAGISQNTCWQCSCPADRVWYLYWAGCGRDPAHSFEIKKKIPFRLLCWPVSVTKEVAKVLLTESWVPVRLPVSQGSAVSVQWSFCPACAGLAAFDMTQPLSPSLPASTTVLPLAVLAALPASETALQPGEQLQLCPCGWKKGFDPWCAFHLPLGSRQSLGSGRSGPWEVWIKAILCRFPKSKKREKDKW